MHTQVERRQWNDPDVERFLKEGRPVILTDVPLTRPLVGKWSFEHLADHYGGPPGLNVHFTPRSTTRFSRFYGKGAGRGGIVGMSFRQFVDVVRRNESAETPPWRHYMQSTLLWGRCSKGHQVEDREIGGSLRAGASTVDRAHFSESVCADLEGLDWAWLERMCAMAGCEGLTETNLWAGASGGCTPLHYDTTSNFLCQLCGRKRLLLFSPADTPKLYPYPATHPANAFAMVDVESPDLSTFAAFGRARGAEAVLEPGECLWMPSYVWHYVKQFEGDETLSLNFWVGAQRDVRAERMFEVEKHAQPPAEAAVAAAVAAMSAAGGGGVEHSAADDTILEGDADDGLLTMQMGRHVEREANNMCAGDAAKAGTLISALAAGADQRWPVGSPVRELAYQVRAHMMTVLGTKRAAAVLRGLARDGRLHPGLAPALRGDVVGTDEHQFTPKDELRQWMRSGEGEAELRKRTLL